MDTRPTSTEAPPGALQDSHCRCFACGRDNPDGLSLQFHAGPDGRARAEWLPSPKFCSYSDRLHGGIIATLLDGAMVHALSLRGLRGVTAELTIRYAAAIRLDLPLINEGWVESTRHGMFLCQAHVTQSGKQCARATGKFMAAPEVE
jgi:acyl-coenzyme A thioesterase PaaI-like protein